MGFKIPKYYIFYEYFGIPLNLVNENKLIGNYPNPFNPTTSINFKIGKAGMISLKIYNTQGREVKCLFNGLMSEGDHEIKFDASGLASGMYFCRLQTDGYTDIIKMQLLK
jgi:hypothetical protein